MKKLQSICILRICAALTVFFLHTWIVTNNLAGINNTWDKLFFLKTPAWGGVWIFFVISGYLAGRGFILERYNLSMKSILHFYLDKLIKVGIPTLFFIFILCVTVYPDFIPSNQGALTALLTFTYNGSPGLPGIGATWFVSTVMQLYLLTPGLYYLLKKLNAGLSGRTAHTAVLIGIIAAGCFYRVLLYKNQISWYSWVYTPSIANLDLFLAGFQMNYLLCQNKREGGNRIIGNPLLILLLLLLVTFNSYLYYFGETESGRQSFLFIYQYVMPSVYAAFISIFLYFFMEKEQSHTENLFEKILNWFDGISFWFYLWHSLILDKIYPHIALSSPAAFHLKLLAVTFVITGILASFYTKAFNMLSKEFIKKQRLYNQ